MRAKSRGRRHRPQCARLRWRALERRATTDQASGWCRSGGSTVEDGFDVVAVGIQDERAVIVRVVVLPYARFAVVGSARGDRSRVERVDRRTVAACECDMGPGADRLTLRDPERRLA